MGYASPIVIAMECTSPDTLATQTACTRVATLYEQNTGTMPPCYLALCPLWTQSDIDATYDICYNYNYTNDTVEDYGTHITFVDRRDATPRRAPHAILAVEEYPDGTFQ